MNAKCETVRDYLNRFLDNDLDAQEATKVAAHLETCTGCRHIHDRLLAVRAALRHDLAGPPPVMAEASRQRVFARLERAVAKEAEEPATAPRKRIEVPQPRGGYMTTLARRLFPVVTPIMAAGIVAGAAFLLVPMAPQEPEAPEQQMTAVTMPLPGQEELAQLYNLHDAHGGALSADDPMLHRSAAADAHASLLEYADASIVKGL